MTTTGTTDHTAGMPAPTPTRPLRRSRTDRIGAGVAGGLGQYFGIDPVIFRVLFATAAFFGGAGVLAYLLAWAAIPDEGTERAPIDGWITSLRRRKVPFWAVAAVAALLFWAVAFSWWAPGPFFPVLVVVIVLMTVFGRRGRPSPAAPVSLTKQPDAPAAAPGEPATGQPDWKAESRRWIVETRAARRERVRRAFPVKVATLVTLAAALLTIGLVDAATGIALPLYFWVGLGILVAGLLVGMVLRRTPWSVGVLLVPAIAGVVAFAGTHASLHDGIGNREWTPTTAPAGHYRYAFGQTTLDLRSLRTQDVPRTVRIDQAAGRLRIVIPRALPVRVVANVHFGVVTLDGESTDDGDSGARVQRIIEPLAGAKGQPIVVDVHLADGQIQVVRD